LRAARSERAGIEYYRRAGEKLLEAKEQVEHGEWLGWLNKNFRLSQQTASIYMQLAEQPTSTTSNYSSLGDFVHQTSNPNYNTPHQGRGKNTQVRFSSLAGDPTRTKSVAC
jgi:hypothetical protein